MLATLPTAHVVRREANAFSLSVFLSTGRGSLSHDVLGSYPMTQQGRPRLSPPKEQLARKTRVIPLPGQQYMIVPGAAVGTPSSKTLSCYVGKCLYIPLVVCSNSKQLKAIISHHKWHF